MEIDKHKSAYITNASRIPGLLVLLLLTLHNNNNFNNVYPFMYLSYKKPPKNILGKKNFFHYNYYDIIQKYFIHVLRSGSSHLPHHNIFRMIFMRNGETE